MNFTQFAVYRNKTVSVYFLQKNSNGNTKNAIASKYNDKQEEMKESKAVYVTKDKIRDDQNLVYQLYRSERDERSQSAQRYEKSFNFGCQYDSKKDNEICTCKNVITLKKKQGPRYFSGSPKQIYAYHRSRSFTEVGVGSVKALQKRKVKRIYLPETDDRGVGSSDLSTFITHKKHPQLKASFYDHKKTSSKCIGGFLECITGRVISEKLSPITHTKSGATSPKISCLCTNIEIGSNTVETELETTGTQFETKSESGRIASSSKTPKHKTSAMEAKSAKKLSQHTQKFKYSNERLEKKLELEKKAKEIERVFSSDSLVQHVHNLEVPCNEKRSRNSFPDPMENQLEREYRKMFSNTKFNDKPSFNKKISECKSPSVLKRRFEALRRGVKKEDSISKNDSLTMDTSTKESPNRKDASVTSDPPSLISRSFSNTKAGSPFVHKVEQDQIVEQTSRYTRDKHSLQWPQDPTESEQGVKGMFKMWGKKFNFEEETNEKQVTPKSSIEKGKKSEKEEKSKTETSPKKESRKFFFFKKKSKDKNKEAYDPKKNVTAGRCEIKDGLTLKLGETTSNKSKISKISEEEDDITRKAWLRRFLSKTAGSVGSVNVRWNNSMYATSSSTVFDLLETIYNNTGVVFKSRSEISTEASSYYRSITQHRVNFVQDIEAWMVSRTIPDRPTSHLPHMMKSNQEIEQKDAIISDQKRFIEKSEGFSNKIKVMLHSAKCDGPTNKKHSEYLRIDMPKHFFDSAISEESKRNHSSDEEVYKIVEYETNSEIGAVISNLKKRSTNDIEVIVNIRDSQTETNVLKTLIKRPTTQRDVVIQGSKVNIPQRCDVIGVGIITQRDLREMEKPILRIQNVMSDEESDAILQTNTNKCVLAESYLQDYCRHWTPLRSCSEKSVSSFFYQAEGTKSCPNIFEDYQAAAMVKEGSKEKRSADNLSASSKCTCDKKPAQPDKSSNKFLKLFKKLDSKPKHDKRVLPKDSVEVHKRRKIYAASAKSQWCENVEKPVSCTDCSGKPKKKEKKGGKGDCKKRVVVPDGILQYRGAGCDKGETCKNTASCKNSKHAVVEPQSSKEIPQPFCKDSCEEMKNPPCAKSSTSCRPDESKSKLSSKASKVSCSCCIQKKSNERAPCVPKKSDIPPCTTCRSTASLKGKLDSPAKSCSSVISEKPPISKQKLCDICGAPQEGCSHCRESQKKFVKSSQSKQQICDICRVPSEDECPSCQISPSKLGKPSESKQNICKICRASPQIGSPDNFDAQYNLKSSSVSASKKSCSVNCCSKSPSQDQMTPYEPPPCLSNLSGCCFSPSSCRAINSESNVSCCFVPSKTVIKKSQESQNERPREICQQTITASGVGISLKIYPAPSKSAPPPPPPPKVSTCNVPSCNQNKKQTSAKTCKAPKTEEKDFPWPMNSQESNCPSPKTCSSKCCSPKKSSSKSLKSKPPSQKCCSPIPIPPKSCSPVKSESFLQKCKNACIKKNSEEKLPKPKECKHECPGKKPSSPKTANKKCPKEACRADGPICPSKDSKPKTTGMGGPICSSKESKPKTTGMGGPICSQIQSKPNISDSAKKKTPSKTINEKCPTEPCRADGPICPSKDSKPKTTGIHLNNKPSEKKTRADDCSAEKTVNERHFSPSSWDREPRHFKLQDKDGKTIAERRDYSSNERHSPVLGNVYRDSNVRRVSTTTSERKVASENNDKDLESKSEQSLSNLIEIQFKLRVTQGDKTTTINAVNDNERNKKTTTENWEAGPSVYVVKNGTEEITDEASSNKNDINIKIIFRNFKPRIKPVVKTISDEFSKNISRKFHTVSTGYSEVMTGVNEDQVYSVHRATINLSSSTDKSKAQSNISSEVTSKDVQDIEANHTVSQNTEQLTIQTNSTENENVEEKSMSTRKNSQSEKLEESNTNESELPDFNDTDDPDTVLMDLHKSNEYNGENAKTKGTSKEEKKLLLKKVFSKVGRTRKTKKSVRQLRDMLKIILTDSSEIDDVNATSNELLRDVTYESLKPNYFRDTDSMNNYYQLDSKISSIKDSKNETIYPSIENSSDSCKESDIDTNQEQCRGCMCSRIAEKLNQCQMQGIRCCCRPNSKRDEETSCDLKNDEDSYLFNNKAVEYTDVETQKSKYISSKINSLNVSIDSKSNTEDCESVKIVDGLDIIDPIIKKKGATFFSFKSRDKEYKIKKLNKNTILGLTEDDKVIVINEKPKQQPKLSTDMSNKDGKFDVSDDRGKADLLQSYEAKKAVLEIYAEKAESGEHLVAKLPKFVYDKESEITRNYEIKSVTMNVNR